MPITPLRVVLSLMFLGVLLGAGLFVAGNRAPADAPMLHDVRPEVLEVFEETLLTIDPEFEMRSHPYPSPFDPFDIPNDPFAYNDCDSWRYWLRSSTWYSMSTWRDIPADNEQQLQELFDSTLSTWKDQQGIVTIYNNLDEQPAAQKTALRLETEHGTYSLSYHEFDNTWSVSAAARGCLPVE